MWPCTLFAADNPLQRPEIVYGTLALAVALFIGAVAISLVDKWRRRAESGNQDSASVLTTYREMYEQGEITDAEYTELRRRLADKVKHAPAATTTGIGEGGKPMKPLLQPGERVTKNPPAHPTGSAESPSPPGTS